MTAAWFKGWQRWKESLIGTVAEVNGFKEVFDKLVQ